jgi:hypothetical protein
MLAILCLVNNFWQNFQPFVNHVLNVAANEKLVEVHNKHTEGQDFAVIFEIFKIDLFLFLFSFLLFSFWFVNFFMKFPLWLFPPCFCYNRLLQKNSWNVVL